MKGPLRRKGVSGGREEVGRGHTFLEKLFELSCELLAHLWFGEVVLEEGDDIFSEGGWFGVASAGWSADEGGTGRRQTLDRVCE